MGLTLNTNSLNLASSGDSGAASGISTSDVTTLIKNNTPWQYIAELTASSSSYLEYTSIPENFYTIRIMYDGLQFSQNTAKNIVFFCRFASGGSASTDFYSSNEKGVQKMSKIDSIF